MCVLIKYCYHGVKTTDAAARKLWGQRKWRRNVLRQNWRLGFELFTSIETREACHLATYYTCNKKKQKEHVYSISLNFQFCFVALIRRRNTLPSRSISWDKNIFKETFNHIHYEICETVTRRHTIHHSWLFTSIISKI